MPDKEKVINGLRAHADGCGYRSHHCDAVDCPYRYGDESCDIEEMCRDALALLQEQEAEIAFLKAMQLQTVHNMSNEDIGNAVRDVLRL